MYKFLIMRDGGFALIAMVPEIILTRIRRKASVIVGCMAGEWLVH
jgi:hypothetical protein